MRDFMKRRSAVLVPAAVVCGVLILCGVKSGSGQKPAEQSEESTEADVSMSSQVTPAVEEEPEIPAYQYVFRELPTPRYLEPEEEFAGGSGTPEDPYQIADAAQLQLLAERINDRESNKTYGSACYVLTADIMFNDISDFENWAVKGPEYSWKTAGNGSALSTFSGDFDGDDHVISGLYISENHPEGEDVGASYGLFGRVSGMVHDLNIEQSYIAVSGYTCSVGTIAGSLAPEGVIDNCDSSAVIECFDANCGGIVGTVNGGYVAEVVYQEDDLPTYSVVRNCKFTGTIEQKKEHSLSNIGGIAGAGKGHIVTCTNQGTICFGGADADSVGGIIGTLNDGMIAGSEHAGALECRMKKTAGATDGQLENGELLAEAGGIAGNLYLSSLEDETYMSRGILVRNCQSTGTVSGAGYAGGIAGNAENDQNAWCLTVESCENQGPVMNAEYAGGIVGRMACNGDSGQGSNVVLKDCKNSADLTAGNAGGVVGRFDSIAGAAVLRNCDNTAAMNAETGVGAGVIAYWQMDREPDIRVLVEESDSSGAVTAKEYAGGIVGLMNQGMDAQTAEKTAVVIQKCKNSGSITAAEAGGVSGGVIGSIDLHTIPVVLSSCKHTEKSGELIGTIGEAEQDSVYIKE